MREFQNYTKAASSAHLRRLLLALSAGLLAVAALLVGMRAGAVPTPMEMLGYGARGLGGRRARRRPSRMAAGTPGGAQRSPTVRSTCSFWAWTRIPVVEGSRTDTIMLVQVVPKTGEVKLALGAAGPACRDRAGSRGQDQRRLLLRRYRGTMGALHMPMPIDYAVVDFEGFRDVINAMGGVEIDVEDEIPPEVRHKGWAADA